MTAPRVYRAEAIVLRQRRLGEADAIVTLYTRQQGKLDAVAKGVLRPTSRLGGHLGPLTHVSLLLARGRDLDVITQAQTLDGHLALRSDLGLLARALYAAELVDRITPDRAVSYPIFNLLLQALRRLPQERGPDTFLRHFEVRLLEQAGYRPELGACVGCRSPLRPVTNAFSPALGGTLCPLCAANEPTARALSVNALKVLRLLQRASIDMALPVRITPTLARELEEHLRAYLHYVLEQGIRSAAFIKTLAKGG